MAKSNSFKMTKQMQQILIALLVLAVIIYAVKKYRDKDEQDQIKAGTNSAGVPTTTNTGSSIPSWQKKYNALPSVGENTILKKGSKSKEVWQLQYLYNENIAKKEGKSKIAVDGIFGSQTESAVKYVTESKFSYIKLSYFQSLVKMTKAQRVAHFNQNSGTSVLVANLYDPLTYTGPSQDNTFVYNP